MNLFIVLNSILLLPVLYWWCKDRVRIPFLLGFVLLSSSVFHVFYNEQSLTHAECEGWCVVIDSYEVTVFGTFLLLWMVKLTYDCCAKQSCCKQCFFFFPPLVYFLFCITQLCLSVGFQYFTKAAKHAYDIGGILVSLVWCLEGVHAQHGVSPMER
jgi:phosphatidylglycerophosphate synthase